MIALGFASNFIPTSVFTLAPETALRPELVGLALATVNMGANLGVIAGPPLLGAILSRGYWAWGSACLVLVMSAGALGALLLAKRIG
jgi:MFS family permease